MKIEMVKLSLIKTRKETAIKIRLLVEMKKKMMKFYCKIVGRDLLVLRKKIRYEQNKIRRKSNLTNLSILRFIKRLMILITKLKRHHSRQYQIGIRRKASRGKSRSHKNKDRPVFSKPRLFFQTMMKMQKLLRGIN